MAVEHWKWRGPPVACRGSGPGRLVKRVKQRLSLASSWTPTLIKALDLCRQLCPRPAEEIAVLLQQNALARVKFHPYGLVTAAKAVGLTHSVALERRRLRISLQCVESADPSSAIQNDLFELGSRHVQATGMQSLAHLLC